MVFWDVTSSTLVGGINILEEPYACIFRAVLISRMTVIMRTSKLIYQTMYCSEGQRPLAVRQPARPYSFPFHSLTAAKDRDRGSATSLETEQN